MKLFTKGKDLTEDESKIFYKEQAKKNCYYVMILSICLAVTETLILIFGFINNYHKGTITVLLLIAYGVVIFTALTFLGISIHLRKDVDKNYKTILILSIFYAFWMVIVCAVITNLDNLHEPNSNNIIVCLIAILGFSTIVYLPMPIYPILLVVNFLGLLLPDIFIKNLNYNVITYINLTIFSITALVAISIQQVQIKRQVINQLTVVAQTEQLKVLNNQLLIQAKTDGLTNLYNRAYFNVRYKELWDLAVANNNYFSTCLIDIDNFKQINDTFGHLIGDKCLRKIASLIQEETDKIGGVCFRYGGEEFLIVCLKVNNNDMVKAMDTLRKRVNEISILEGRPNISITIGISETIAFQSLNCYQILSEADEALYYGKEHGKNTVVCHKDI